MKKPVIIKKIHLLNANIYIEIEGEKWFETICRRYILKKDSLTTDKKETTCFNCLKNLI